MILSGKKIQEEVSHSNIGIEPFNESLLNPNSYNYRLGETLYEVVDNVIDPKQKTKYKKIKLTDKGYTLKPNKLYLGSTYEKIGSSRYVTQLIGRSSMGRLGLFLQMTAPLGHVGCYHNWTLELKCVQPLKVYPHMRIGQVTFWVLDGEVTETYDTGKYNRYKKPGVSLFYREMEKRNDFIR